MPRFVQLPHDYPDGGVQMSTQQHTPGPWTAHGFAIHGPGTPPGRDTTIAVASARIVGGSPVSRANARLIAAAPDMLAALQEIERGVANTGSDPIQWMTTITKHDAWLIARAAIAKATGG